MSNKNLFKSISSDTLIYGVMKYFTVLVSVILTPIYTRILTKEDFGVMDAFNTWNAMIIGVLHLGLYNAIQRFYPEIKNDTAEKKKVLGSILFMLLLMGLIYALAITAFKTLFLHTYLGITGQDAVFNYSIVIVFLSIFYSYFLYLLQSKFEKYRYAAITLINFCLLASLGFYFVYAAEEGISGFFKASCIGLLVANLLGFYFLRKEIFIAFHYPRLKKLLSYSIHFIAVSFLFQVSGVIDRYLIKQYLSLSDIGIYSIAMRVSNFLQIAIGSFGTAWMPYALSIMREEGNKNIYRKVFEFYVVTLTVAITMILIFRKELLEFFAPAYFEAYHTIAWLLLLNFTMGSVYVLTIGLHIAQKTNVLSWAASLSILCNFGVSILLVKSMGINGIALGSVAGAVVWIAVQHYYSQSYFHINFAYWKNFLVAATLLIPLTGSLYLDQLISTGWMLITVKCIIGLTMLSFLYIYIKRNKSLKRITVE